MIKFNFTIFTIFIIVLIINIEISEATRKTKFLNSTYRWNPKYFSNFTYYLKNDSVFVDLLILKPLVTGFKANVDFQIRLANSKKYQSLFAYTLDVCNMVVSYKDTIFKKWFKSFLRYGNFMQNCPVNVGHYYLNGWKMDGSLIPTYLYPGDYRVKGYGFYGKLKGKDEEFVVELALEAIISG